MVSSKPWNSREGQRSPSTETKKINHIRKQRGLQSPGTGGSEAEGSEEHLSDSSATTLRQIQSHGYTDRLITTLLHQEQSLKVDRQGNESQQSQRQRRSQA